MILPLPVNPSWLALSLASDSSRPVISILIPHHRPPPPSQPSLPSPVDLLRRCELPAAAAPTRTSDASCLLRRPQPAPATRPACCGARAADQGGPGAAGQGRRARGAEAGAASQGQRGAPRWPLEHYDACRGTEPGAPSEDLGREAPLRSRGRKALLLL